MLCYFSLPGWPNINALCTAIECERFSVMSHSPQVLPPLIEGIVSHHLFPLVCFVCSFLSSAYPSMFVFPPFSDKETWLWTVGYVMTCYQIHSEWTLLVSRKKKENYVTAIAEIVLWQRSWLRVEGYPVRMYAGLTTVVTMKRRNRKGKNEELIWGQERCKVSK
jgi:hypothetical protein